MSAFLLQLAIRLGLIVVVLANAVLGFCFAHIFIVQLIHSLGNALPKRVEQANDECKIRDVWCNELRSSQQAQQDTREDRTSCGFTGDMKVFALNCLTRFQVNALDTAPEIHCRREQDDNDPKGTGLYEIDLNWLQYSESSGESQANLQTLELK